MELAKSFGVKILDWKVLNVDKTQNRAMVKVRENSIAMGEENTQINTYRFVQVEGRWLFNEWPFEEETKVGEGGTGKEGEWKTRTENILSTVQNISRRASISQYRMSPSFIVHHYWSAKEDDVENIEITGTVRELNGMRFNLYAFDKHNYELWNAGANYKTMENRENVSSYNFTLHPTYNQVKEGIRLVVSNKILQKRHKVEFYSDTITLYDWQDNTHEQIYRSTPVFKPLPARISGTASEIKDRLFDFLIMNEENFHRWDSGFPSNAYYGNSGKSSYSFSYTLPYKEAKKPSYIVISRAGQNGDLKVDTSFTVFWKDLTDITVEISAQLKWKEKT